jgi:transposase
VRQATHDAESYRRVEVITGASRRKHWSDAEKVRIVGKSAEPGVNISEVARRNGVSRGLLNVWRREARQAMREDVAFVQLRVADGLMEVDAAVEGNGAGKLAAVSAETRIDVVIGDATVRVPMGVDKHTLERVLAAVRTAR